MRRTYSLGLLGHEVVEGEGHGWSAHTGAVVSDLGQVEAGRHDGGGGLGGVGGQTVTGRRLLKTGRSLVKYKL